MIKFYSKEKFANLPDAIFFDIDNTMYAYEPTHKIALGAVRDKIIKTFAISSGDFDQTFNNARLEVKNRLSHTAASHSRLLYFQRMLEMMGLGSQVLVALDLEQTYWRTFLSNVELFEGVKEFLDDIRLLGIPIAVVTDLTAQIQFRKLIYFGFDQYFDYVITSEEAGFDKPHELPYKLAIEKINPKGNCIWMIGDNPINDIGGSREAINAITLQKIHDGLSLHENIIPDLSFNDFNELRKLIAGLGKIYE